MPSSAAILEVGRSLATLAIIALAAYGVGRPLFRRLRLAELDSLAVAIWSLSLGLVLVGTLLLLLAHAGWLPPELVQGITVLSLCWCGIELACEFLGTTRPIVWPRDRPETEALGEPADENKASISEQLTRPAMAVAALLVGISLLGALVPPTSNRVLSHGLEVPKQILLNHGLHNPTVLRLNNQTSNEIEVSHKLRPSLGQVWSLWALALDGPVAANLVHWGIGLLLALATVLLAKAYVDAPLAWIAGGLVFISPGVQQRLGLPADGLPLALLTTLALTAFSQIIVHLETQRWAIVGGIMLGAATGAQPCSWQFLVAVLFAVAYSARVRQQTIRPLTVEAKWGLLAGICLAAPWFGVHAPLTIVSRAAATQTAISHCGPLLLAALGGLCFARRLRGLSFLGMVLGPYALTASCLAWDAHWWPPVVPLIAVVAAWILHEAATLPRAAKVAVGSLTVALALAGLAMPLAADFGQWPVALGWQSRHEFLLQHAPTYQAASLLNRITAADCRVFSEDPRTLYVACRADSSASGNSPAIARTSIQEKNSLIAWARRAGYAYLLLADEVEGNSSHDVEGASNADQSPSKPQLASRSARIGGKEPPEFGEVLPILEYRCADSNNRSMRYRLLWLPGSPAASRR